jgi:hypothetical protein
VDIRITPFTNLTPLTKTNIKGTPSNFVKIKIQPRTENNNTQIILSENKVYTPDLVLKTTSNMVQTESAAKKSGVLLYQQIEGDGFTTSEAELINRFHYQV